MTDPGLAQAGPGPEPEGPEPQAGEQPATVIVVGSFHWSSPGAVHDQLGAWAESHGWPHVMLVTSGCPQGAELDARQFGEANGWSLATLRDEELIQLPQAIAFVFIRDESPGATRALEIIERAKIWHRVTRDATVRIVSPWADR